MRGFALLLLPLAFTARAGSADDYVLPGELTRDTTRAHLEARFGAANVVPQTLDGAEGSTFEGLVLFPNDATRRAEILLPDDGSDGVSAIRVTGETSRWKLDTGVHPGMTLADLVALNGQPIVFSGLDWDYGGSVLQWNGGKLEPDEGGLVYRSLTLTHPDDAPDGAYPLGDGEYRSDDPKYPQQGNVLRVGQVMVSFVEPVENTE